MRKDDLWLLLEMALFRRIGGYGAAAVFVTLGHRELLRFTTPEPFGAGSSADREENCSH
jgi:hypothetical protein